MPRANVMHASQIPPMLASSPPARQGETDAARHLRHCHADDRTEVRTRRNPAIAGIDRTGTGVGESDLSALAIQSERLILLAESLHWRRLENCLIPALREASNDALLFLQALEKLGRAAVDMLPLLRTALMPAPSPSRQHIAGACGTVNSYCQNLLQRLAFEEQQLLPLAQRLLATDAWFRVGTAFLLQDARS